MWKVSWVILLILASAHANVPISEQEHNMTKREIDQQIIGGSAVSMPTAVFILIKPDEDTTNSCSGTILSEDIVLSAGHCFDIPGSYANVTTIVAGVSDLRNYLTGKPNIAQIFNVERVTIHPRYSHVDGEPGDQEELIWDLAIIKLSSKMEIGTNPNMEAVKLPPPGIRHAGKIVRVGGWGRYTPHSGVSLIHQEIHVMINPDTTCSDTYDVGEYLPSLMFCAGERGQTTCRGDSGSGALFSWNNKKILIGVLSFGTTGCKTASVFQRVEKSLPWIFRETKLRPAYEVFEDDLLYEEFLDDVDVVTHSPKFQTDLDLAVEWRDGVMYLANNARNSYGDIPVRSYHMSCDSDTFDGQSNYIGIVLYQKDGSNSFSINGRNIRPGYIYLVKTSKLSKRSGETLHAAAYEHLFGVPPPRTGLVSSGFSHFNGAFIKKSSTFNYKQNAYTGVLDREMHAEEFEMVKNAIIRWSCNGQQNLVPKRNCRITRSSSNACPIHETELC